ncbi:hypothetical protein, partial [Runella sp.]|uniref:hypothetical protein n=1 Tax=Runella sp. TaxID=1960881 RepID=UPI0030188737
MKLRRIILVLLLMQYFFNLNAQGWRRSYSAAETQGVLFAFPYTSIQTPDSGYLNLVELPTVTQRIAFFKINKNGDFEVSKFVNAPLYASSNIGEATIYKMTDQSYLAFAPIFGFDTTKFIKIDENANIIKLKNLPANRFYKQDIAVNQNGFIRISNDVNPALAIEQYDSDLNFVWKKELMTPPSGVAEVRRVWVGDDQSIYYTTYDSNENKFYLTKLTSNGDFDWTKIITGYDKAAFYYYGKPKLVVKDNGDFYLSTFYPQQGEFVTHITKWDKEGVFKWTRIFPGILGSFNSTKHNGVFFTTYDYSSPGRVILRALDENDKMQLEKYYYAAASLNALSTFDGGYFIACQDYEYFGLFIKTDSLGRTFPNYINGKVKYDLNHNCINDNGEDPLLNWVITAEHSNGKTDYALTDSTGGYEINIDTGQYTLKIHPPGPVWQPCNNGVYQVDLNQLFDTTVIDIPVQDSAYCSLLNVSIATTRIRRCFNNTYWLNWQNFGTADAENVQIDVVLPPELDFVSASPLQPEVIGDTLRFSPGTVPYGASGYLSLVVHADCDSTILGQTLCVEAWIRPDTLCYDIPNWSGAEVVANAHCTSDTTVQYTLKNVGNGPTGDLNY